MRRGLSEKGPWQILAPSQVLLLPRNNTICMLVLHLSFLEISILIFSIPIFSTEMNPNQAVMMHKARQLMMIKTEMKIYRGKLLKLK